MSIDPFCDPALPDLLSRALELRDQGEPYSLEHLCGERGDLLAALAESVDLCTRIPDLRRAAITQDHQAGRVLEERYK